MRWRNHVFVSLCLLLLLGCTHEVHGARAVRSASGVERLKASVSNMADAQAQNSPDIEYASLKKQKAGDFLNTMEWTQGSDDISAEVDNHPYILKAKPGHTLPSSMFGVFKGKDGKPVTDLFGNPATRKDIHKSDQVAAAMVRAYSDAHDYTAQGDSMPVRDYNYFMKKNPWFGQNMKELFSKLDLNSDGALDNQELQHAVGKGYLSIIGARLLKTWDVNFSHRVSWIEFKHGPLFLNLLESHRLLLAKFKAKLPGSEKAATKLYRSVLSPWAVDNPAAFGLLEESSTISSSEHAPEAPRFEVPQPKSAHDQTVSLLGLDEEANRMRTDAQSRRVGFLKKIVSVGKDLLGGFMKAKHAATVSDPKKAAPSAKPDPRPKSKFGIPSMIDEECVMCQYIVQRTMKDLEKKVVDDYTAFDDIPNTQESTTGGIAGINQVLGRSGSIRDRGPTQRLRPSRGMTSPIRMIKEVFQLQMRKSCGESAPDLFKRGCGEIWKVRKKIAEGIFLKKGAGGSCQRAQICGMRSYFGGPYAVHDPILSDKYNGFRGLCGMIGGPNAREIKGVSASMCATQKIGEGVGNNLRHRFNALARE